MIATLHDAPFITFRFPPTIAQAYPDALIIFNAPARIPELQEAVDIKLLRPAPMILFDLDDVILLH